jgi:preprotein translocase subunit SecG
MAQFLTAAVAILSVVVIFLILMHSGKDAGLSGAFGVGTGEGSLGGGSLVERNLNRWTVGLTIIWVLSILALVKVCKVASAASPAFKSPLPSGAVELKQFLGAGRRWS